MKKILFLCSGLVLCATVVFGQAAPDEEYQLLSGVPGLAAVDTSSGNFSDFINTIYRMSIGLGSALAVIIILIAGIQYSYSANFTAKQLFKEKIGMALGGLALLMGAFIFLQFINPDLTDLNNKGAGLSNLEFNKEDFEPISIITIADIPPVNTSVQTDVWVSIDGTSGSFDTEQECITSGDPREPTRCQYIPNPDLDSISTPPTGIDDGILTLAANSPAMNVTLHEFAKNRIPELANWPSNPYRAPADFIDCKGPNFNSGSQSVKVTRQAVAADAWINYNLEKLGIKGPIPINSAFRNNYPPGSGSRCVTSGTRSNHPHGASFDYSMADYNSAERKIIQRLALESGALRLGFGGNFFHVQWNNPGTSANIYWCYSSNHAGPYDSQSMPGNWSRGGSCSG